MKNILKYSLALLTVLMGFSSCSDSDDNYQKASVSGPQVFFDKDMSKVVNLTFDDTSFKVPVSRANDAEAVTVSLSKEDEENLFTVPSSVSFAAGQSVAEIEIGLDPSKFEFNEFKTLTLTVDPEQGTPYGIGTLTLSVGMPLTWKTLGKGTYVDTWFGHQTNPVIQQCEQNPQKFRIAAPYADYDGDDYFDMSGTMDEYLELTVLKPGDVFNDVTITENDLVVFPIYSTGAIHPSYTDDVIVMMHPSEYSSMASDQTKWTFNRVLEYDANGIPAKIQLAPSYYMMKYGGWNNTQNDGVITIYFPGNDPLDYDVEVTYNGKNVSPDDEYTAQFSIKVGADLEEVKYAFVAGGDVNDVLVGILNGSIETESISKSTDLNISVEKAGTYTLVAVGYAEGEAQTYDAETILFEMGGGETWTAVAHGVYNYNVEPITEDGTSAYIGQSGAVLYQSSLDESRYRIAPWAHWSSNGLIFSWNKETNVIKADGVDTGEDFVAQGTNYGRILFSDIASLDPESFGSYPSTYNPETKTFEFWCAYHFGEYWLGAVIETFVIDDELPAATSKRAAAQRSMKANKRKVRFDIPAKRETLR